MESIIDNQSNKHPLRSLMKQKFAPWAAALLSAITIHIVLIELSDSQDWFKVAVQPTTIELQLLPTQTPATETSTIETPSEIVQPDEQELAVSVEQNENASPPPVQQETKPQTPSAEKTKTAKNPAVIVDDKVTGKELSEKNSPLDAQEIAGNMGQKEAITDKAKQNSSPSSDALDASLLGSERPSLLDLSNVTLPSNINDEALTDIFSAELRDKIAESKRAQKEYLNSLTKEVDYPITEDADGTRYANIKGVCWRLPKEGSTEGWAIVFDGCGIESKLFHFELNISPKILTNELLGPDSPFNIDQPIK
jgi:hypothetical protein